MDKIYIGTGKQIETKYGSMLKLSIHNDDICKMQDIANENNGWINLVVKERREPSEKGQTHYLEVDFWKPERKDEPVTASVADDSDSLPF